MPTRNQNKQNLSLSLSESAKHRSDTTEATSNTQIQIKDPHESDTIFIVKSTGQYLWFTAWVPVGLLMRSPWGALPCYPARLRAIPPLTRSPKLLRGPLLARRYMPQPVSKVSISPLVCAYQCACVCVCSVVVDVGDWGLTVTLSSSHPFPEGGTAHRVSSTPFSPRHKPVSMINL